MNTVTIIVLGVVAITVIGIVGDVLTKLAQAKVKGRAATASSVPPAEIEAIHRRIGALESRVEERDESVRKLQEELRFVSRILEDKSGGQGRV